MHVFGYGSLLEPASLARTLPEMAPEDCRPARVRGYLRTFEVAFPNDGSQPDKAFVDEAGQRPPFVLFANLRAGQSRWANGICIPVGEEQLAALCRRERRYMLADVTDRVTAYPGVTPPAGPVVAFLGQPAHTRTEHVAAGAVPRTYLDSLTAGARFWSRTCPGFLDDLHDSTRMPTAVHELRRIDLPAAGEGGTKGAVAAATPGR